MASAHLDQSSVLQEELTCPVCLDLYRDPLLLPCGHNFCKSCLRRLKRQAEMGRFRCPECRNSYRCGSVFQKNYKLANIADDYRLKCRASSVAATALKSRELLKTQKAIASLAVPCDYCPSVSVEVPGISSAADGSPATSLSQEAQNKQEGVAAASSSFAVKTCLKCEVSMCQEHVKPHLELPAFREHPLTEPMKDFWKRKCPSHDEIFRYYCMDDRMCVCNACTIEGGHSGHTIKTLKNSMKDIKVMLDKQLYKVEKKYSAAEKKLQEQKEKERQNKKLMEDSEQSLAQLGEDLKAKVQRFMLRLQDFMRCHCNTNGPTIQKNIARISQDQARLQEVRCGLESLMQESDPFHFIEAYRTTGRQCLRQLKKDMFYPEYVDMETEVVGVMMEDEMKKFVDEELPFQIVATINSLCHILDQEEEEEQEDNDEEEEEEEEEEDDDDDDDDEDVHDDSSEEVMRSEGEEEEDEEEDEEEMHDRNELADLYSPGEEEEEEEDEEDDEEQGV